LVRTQKDELWFGVEVLAVAEAADVV
jgi:hypothetical protein